MKKNVLVGGLTGSGKTIFSHRLVDGFGYSRIAGDALVLAFEKSFPKLGIGHELAGKSPEQAYESACTQFGPFLVELMNALAWESTRPCVVDTFHVRPRDLHGIDERRTTVLFFGYPEADAGQKALQMKRYQTQEYGAPCGWVASDMVEVREKFRIFIQMSRDLREECLAHGFTFVDTGGDFAQSLSVATGLATSEDRTYD